MALRSDLRDIGGSAFDGVAPGGRLMIFGRPTLMWEGAPSPEDYYKSFGFAEVHTLDVSDYEGATFVHDLNNPVVPTHLCGRYRAVLTGGTLEHIFDVWSAFKVAIALLEPGGHFYCAAPVNNWVDHGFWQISPTLKFDFFATNGFDFCRSVASVRPPDFHFTRNIPLYPGEGTALNFLRGRVGHMLEVVKTAGATVDKIPLQNLYLKKHANAFRGWRFRASMPFDLIDKRVQPPPMRRFPLAPSEMIARDGTFVSPFRRDDLLPSVPPGRPFRSRALVTEDGELLPWIVSSRELVAERPGSFAHLGGHIVFTSTDGSDPRHNGRRYDVLFPQPFKGLLPYADDPLYQRLEDDALKMSAASLAV